MSSAYGLTPAGFRVKSQQQIISEINAAMQALWGTNVNLGAESTLGQIVGIFSGREALLWELAQALYASQYPMGAEGVALDNILALSNLTRLPASPTVTDPTPVTQSTGVPLFGLVLSGVPGTVIPSGSQIKTTTTPQLTFTLDNTVVIQSAANASQNVVFSNVPNAGTYRLSLTNTGTGQVLTTPSMRYDTLASQTRITVPTPPSSGSVYIMLGGLATGPLAYNASAATIQAAIRGLSTSYAAATVTGTWAAGFLVDFGGGFAHTLSVVNTLVAFAATPATGTFSLNVGGTVLSFAYNVTAAAMQAAIQAVYPRTLVAQISVGGAPAYVINWIGLSAPPAVTLSQNTTGAGLTVGPSMTLDQTPTVVQALQAMLANLYDPVLLARPFSDITVTGSLPVYTITFGGGTAQGSAPSSGNQPQPLLSVAANTLQQGTAFTNVSASLLAAGAPAQGIGSATCTVDGPHEVVAGQLAVIGTPISGWTAVTNQLDCLPGTNVESDAEALARRADLLGSQANGPLQAIVKRVQQVSGVDQAVGFVNVTGTALQQISFSTAPSGGTYQLLLSGGTTAPIAGTASASVVQQAINQVAGYSLARVTGSTTFGFVIDFNGSQGSQTQNLIQVLNNTTSVTISAAYGRSPNSFEVVVDGGLPTDIAKAIYASQPAGVASYGTPAAVTTGTVTAGSTSVIVASTTGLLAGLTLFGVGIANNTQVQSVVGTTVNLSQPAIGSAANTPLTFNYSTQILDDWGNPVYVSFSRPIPVLIYVQITLVTDQYLTPGDPNSGTNPNSKFQPGTIPQIQEDIVTIGNRTPLGGLIVAYGTGGLIGAFNEVPGILSYSLTFGPTPNPSGTQNIQLLPTQAATFEQFNVGVVYT